MSHRHDTTHRDNRPGFTVVELIVVITLFSLLIALLLPALRQSREQARLVVCLSNQRQIGTGFYAYVVDNDNRVMPLSHNDKKQDGSPDATNITTNMTLHSDYTDVLPNSTKGGGKGAAALGFLYWPSHDVSTTAAMQDFRVNNYPSGTYLTDYGVFFCPANSINKEFDLYANGHWDKRRIAYSYRSPLRSIDYKNLPDDRRKPSYLVSENVRNGIIVAYDNVGLGGQNYAWGGSHGERTNVLYSDGHARTIQWGIYPDRWLTSTGTRGDHFVDWVEDGADPAVIVP